MGYSCRSDEAPLTLDGAGLTWTRRVYTTFLPGTVPPGTSGDAIWTAWAAEPIVAGTVTAKRSSTVETAVLTLAVYRPEANTVLDSRAHADGETVSRHQRNVSRSRRRPRSRPCANDAEMPGERAGDAMCSYI
jgi:hypothetical protein